MNMGAETTSPGGPKFEIFIPPQLVFELVRFVPSIGISVFWLENPYHVTDCSQNLHKDRSILSYLHYVSSKFQVSTFRCFEVIAISASGCTKTIDFARKKTNKFPTRSVAKVLIC